MISNPELKKPQRKYTPEERKIHIEQWKQSKLTRNKYCRREGLCPQTFSYWLKGAKTTQKSKAALSFISMGTVKEPSVNKNESRLEIKLPNGLQCCFVNLADSALLVKIVRGLSHVAHH